MVWVLEPYQNTDYRVQYGVIQQLRGHNFAIFWLHPLLCVDTFYFLEPELDNKQTFFDPHPLILSR